MTRLNNGEAENHIQNGDSEPNSNAEDATKSAKAKRKSDITLEDMYNTQYDLDEEEDEDSDWEPFENHHVVEIAKWFCVNCTIANLDNFDYCNVCGEHKNSGILKHGFFASPISQDEGLPQNETEVAERHKDSCLQTIAPDKSTAIGFDERMLLHEEVEMKSHPHPERPDHLRAIAASLAIAEVEYVPEKAELDGDLDEEFRKVFDKFSFTESAGSEEMELSEDYTCVITHGTNPKTTHIFDNCIVESCCEDRLNLSDNKRDREFEASFSVTPSVDFLTCHTCKNSLGDGKDVYLYSDYLSDLSTTRHNRAHVIAYGFSFGPPLLLHFLPASSGTKKGELFFAHVNTRLKHKNITIDVKVDTNSNLFTTVTIDEIAPGLKTILSFRVSDQRSGKADEFNKQLGNGVDIRNNVKAMAKLKKQVKRTKEILSANTMGPISVESLYDDCDFRSGKSVLFPGKGSNCYDLCLKSNSDHKQRGIQCRTPEKYSKIGFMELASGFDDASSSRLGRLDPAQAYINHVKRGLGSHKPKKAKEKLRNPEYPDGKGQKVHMLGSRIFCIAGHMAVG